jgi:DNA-binding NtrC family response regulator
MKRSSLLRKTLEEFERGFLQAELDRRAWNRTRAARELGISYRALLYKIKRLDLVPPPDADLNCETLLSSPCPSHA